MTLDTQTTPILDGRFVTRAATYSDIYPAIDLFNAADHPYVGFDMHDPVTLHLEWTNEKFNLDESTRLVLTPNGQIVGYVELYDTHEVPVRPFTWARVHPDYLGQGIGGWMLHWAEDRARRVFQRVPDDARVVLMSDTDVKNTAAAQLFSDSGMTTERRAWKMLIEMDSPPADPVLPDGITITTHAELDDLEAYYRALRDSFQDHRGHVDQSFEAAFANFKHFWLNDPDTDFSTWFAAVEGDQIAGIALCSPKSHGTPGGAHVAALGVVRDYRRRGLGMALLQHTFKAFWERGTHKVDLGVDATSLTGATRIYERAGMHVDRAFDVYEKELRPGKEYSKQ